MLTIDIRTQENGWGTVRQMEIEDPEGKLLKSLLTCVKNYRKKQEEGTEKKQVEASPLSQPSAASSPAGGAKEPETVEVEEDPEDKKYISGRMICKCEKCGKVKAFTSRMALSYYKCDECGAKTDLIPEHMAPAILRCADCGKTYKYMTNVVDGTVEASCLKCGKTLVGWWNPKTGRYETK